MKTEFVIFMSLNQFLCTIFGMRGLGKYIHALCLLQGIMGRLINRQNMIRSLVSEQDAEMMNLIRRLKEKETVHEDRNEDGRGESGEMGSDVKATTEGSTDESACNDDDSSKNGSKGSSESGGDGDCLPKSSPDPSRTNSTTPTPSPEQTIAEMRRSLGKKKVVIVEVSPTTPIYPTGRRVTRSTQLDSPFVVECARKFRCTRMESKVANYAFMPNGKDEERIVDMYDSYLTRKEIRSLNKSEWVCSQVIDMVVAKLNNEPGHKRGFIFPTSLAVSIRLNKNKGCMSSNKWLDWGDIMGRYKLVTVNSIPIHRQPMYYVPLFWGALDGSFGMVIGFWWS